MPPVPPAAAVPLVRLQLICTGDCVQAKLAVLEEHVELVICLQGEDAAAVSLSIATVETSGNCAGTFGNVEGREVAAQAADSRGTQDAAAEQQDDDTSDQEKHATLLAENRRLQSLVRQYIDNRSKASRKSMQEASCGQVMEGAEQRYQLALQQLHKLMAQKAEAQVAAARSLAPERARLAAAEARAQAQRAALLAFIADAAAAAGVAADTAQAFAAAEAGRGGKARALRLACARLTLQLAAAEQRLKDSDQLSAEGLHLVDFEQLRIENASLAAKQEARGAEVDKLRGKLAQAVQIAAHVREKLHCAELERSALAASLEAAEVALQDSRAEVSAAKVRRERAKKDREELAQDWRIVSDRRCLDDMLQQQARLAQLQAQAAALQAQYQALGGR